MNSNRCSLLGYPSRFLRIIRPTAAQEGLVSWRDKRGLRPAPSLPSWPSPGWRLDTDDTAELGWQAAESSTVLAYAKGRLRLEPGADAARAVFHRSRGERDAGNFGRHSSYTRFYSPSERDDLTLGS